MSLVGAAVRIADGVTKGLGFQPVVVHRVWKSQDDEGAEEVKDVRRRGVVSLKSRRVPTAAGQEQLSTASVLLLAAVDVGVNDKFKLPGEAAWRAVVSVDKGVADGASPTGQGYLTQVFLG